MIRATHALPGIVLLLVAAASYAANPIHPNGLSPHEASGPDGLPPVLAGGGVYDIVGTTAQPGAVGISNSDTYELRLGFWYFQTLVSCADHTECAGVDLVACTVEKCTGGFCVVSSFISGDVNEDGAAGLSDLLVLLDILGGAAAEPSADLDADGAIGLNDLLILLDLLGGSAGACPA